MKTPIILEEYECGRCGRYFYVHQHIGIVSILGVRCPFFCNLGFGSDREPKFIRLIRAYK